ncbi:MAG: spore maturation protein [Eubacteriales bacterium]
MIDYISSLVIPLMILIIIIYGKIKKVNMYEAFADGAKDSISTVQSVFPHLAAMLIAVGIFRSSGLMDYVINGISPVLAVLKVPKEVFPLAIMRPISGSGSMAILTDILVNHHPDSFIGKMASTMMGSTETTFYVIALYFGSVGIKKYKYAVKAALIADFTGLIASITICTLLF